MDDLKIILEKNEKKYNNPDFVPNDPILVPKRYELKEDIEIAGFFTSIFAWGNRKTIINKSTLLMNLMDNSPYDFILNHTHEDLKSMRGFVHRTFNDEDLYYFIHRLKRYYNEDMSLEYAFSKHLDQEDLTIEKALIGFYESFFSDDCSQQRTHKHIASPLKKSTCKRLCMYMRWMVRNDEKGVDFGIWDTIKPSQLMIPFDVHVERIAREFGLIERKQKDWKAVIELTDKLRRFDPLDPVKYDFALFGIGVNR